MTDNIILGAGLADELTSTSHELERIRDIADGLGKTLTDAFHDAALEGRSLNTLLGDLSRKLADITLTAALKPVGTLVSGAIEGLFSATNPVLNPTAFARGGVVGGPSLFGYSGGLGLMGEGGPEAIMPLSRGPDGRLGVAGGGSSPINITFNVSTPNAGSFRQSEAEISAMLLSAVRRGTRAS